MKTTQRRAPANQPRLFAEPGVNDGNNGQFAGRQIGWRLSGYDDSDDNSDHDDSNDGAAGKEGGGQDAGAAANDKEPVTRRASAGEEDQGDEGRGQQAVDDRHDSDGSMEDRETDGTDSHNVLRRALTAVRDCKQLDDMTSDAVHAHAALLLRSTYDVQCLLSCVPLLSAALQQDSPGSSEAERGFFDAARLALEVASEHLPEAFHPAAEDVVCPNEAHFLSSFDAAFGAIGLDPGSFDFHEEEFGNGDGGGGGLFLAVV